MSPCIEVPSHWWDSHPPVGVFIAILAGIGILVPLFREWGTIGKWEKAGWTFFMAVLVVLELRTLYLDRDEHDAQQALTMCREVDNFRNIAEKLSNSIAVAQDHYKSTIDHVDGVMKTTQSVATLARKNLNEITGSDSYAYVIPATIIPKPGHFSRPYSLHDGFTMWIQNDGKYILSQVTFAIGRVKKAGTAITDAGLMDPHAIGTLAPSERTALPNYFMRPQPREDGIDEYLIYVTAQNGSVIENLQFRISKDGSGWAYRLTVNKEIWNKTPIPAHKLLKEIDWTEPSYESESSVK